MPQALFRLGYTCITRGALSRCRELGINSSSLLDRHVRGDWEEMDVYDRQANTKAIKGGSRIFSRYEIQGVKLYVITEADRSVTTILLPEEY